ncbi:hypothetical protein, partial [Stenotrophomonas maltophilia]|uniref:hypothetical protein n=1 Tax=Stenotrophomonas maltophilia TaxID=40324 RepID=UPI001EF86C0F
FGAAPNTQASLVDLAMPGTLPVLNEEAVRMACLFGLLFGGLIERAQICFTSAARDLWTTGRTRAAFGILLGMAA